MSVVRTFMPFLGLGLITFLVVFLCEVYLPTTSGFPLSAEPLAFGTAWAESAAKHELTVINRLDTPVRILDFRTSCGCTSITPRQAVVSGNGTATFQLTIDLRRFRPSSPGELRDFDVDVTPVTDVLTEEPVAWTVRGKVQRLETIEPPSLVLGSRSVRSLEFETVTARISLAAPVESIEAVCEPDSAAQVSVVPEPDGNQRQFQMIVRPTPEGRVGDIGFVVQLTAKLQDSDVATVTFPVTGTISDDVEAIPKTVLFGVCSVGDERIEQVELRSRTGSRFSVVADESLLPSGDCTIDVDGSPNGGNSVFLRVSQRIAQEGYTETPVTVNVLHEDGLKEQITIPIRYVGGSDGS